MIMRHASIEHVSLISIVTYSWSINFSVNAGRWFCFIIAGFNRLESQFQNDEECFEDV